MFKSAATKIAHNSTLPSLAGNYDLKPLQDLINAEKVVLISLQKMSVDFARAADALRAWGMGEGEDFGDTLSASTNLLNYFSNALSQFATHEHTIREHMKAIRTREENLDELKRRRRALVSKADTAEKKLSKMSPEHKNLHAQMDTLNRLRDEIRTMDSEIMSEEAALGDFKRSEMRTLLGLKFGGLLECCEKGTIAGEFGKLVVMEIPNEVTQPGMARSMYVGHQKVYSLLQDAQQCVSEIAFSTVPSSEPRLPRPPNPEYESHQQSDSFDNDPPYPPHLQGSDSFSGGPETYFSAPQDTGTGHFMDPSDMSSMTGRSSVPNSPVMPPNLSYPPAPPQNQLVTEQVSSSADDFGVGHSTISSPPTGGRFATFPVKANAPPVGYQLRDAPPKLRTSPSREDDSFSSSIEAALNNTSGNGRSSIDGPPPSYTTHQSHPSNAPSNGPSSGVMSPAQLESHWQDARSPMVIGAGGHERGGAIQEEESDEGGLAYDRLDDEPIPAPHGRNENDTHKHVRFGDISDVEEEIQKRQEQERSPSSGTGSLGERGTKPSSRRVPPPTFSTEGDEKELNAAAAREISRELDALKFSVDSGTPYGGDSSPTTPRARNDSFPANATDGEVISPLVPPVAPFAQRGPSPRPETVPSSSPTAPPPTAIAHQSPLGNVQPVTNQDYEFDHPTSSVSDTREPSSPSSPISPKSPISSMSKPTMNVPTFEHRSNSSVSSLRGGGGSSPYQTPPEYPIPRSPLGTRSTSSLVGEKPDRSPGGTPAPPPPGVRTISAAAFRRQPVRGGTGSGGDAGPGAIGGGGSGIPETTPLHLKKRLPLPSSPYPSQRAQVGGGRDRADSEPFNDRGPNSGTQAQSRGRGQSFTGAGNPDEEDQYDYDYLSAYTGAETPSSTQAPGSPLKGDFGSLGHVRVVNDGSSLPPGAGPPVPGGYGDGRFATNLENESLR
ncbi:hypothetical protein E1B28_010211 [Marasmius oreades]|uniref:Eisosome component PIL1-domain-containing protein n=1 Tax=Marasmius oreades TaxID=181124 RepID=A0A9P7UR92_9AGAR|nr:uncharacterized protein E1B28_010211 [Marasmius oreades]KAG7091158.1 hypothetical protein E1B28_010211 [Marasmius oreades]